MGTNLSRKELESNQVKMRNSASGKSEHQLNSAVASQGDFFCEGSIYLDMLRFLKIPSLTFITQQGGNLLLQPVFKSISLFFFFLTPWNHQPISRALCGTSRLSWGGLEGHIVCSGLFWYLYLAWYLYDEGHELRVSDDGDWVNLLRKLNFTDLHCKPHTFRLI